jgi:Family of unknown function (DUF6188)
VSVSSAGWSAPVSGFAITDVRFSGQVHITAYGSRAEGEKGSPRTTITLGGDFILLDRFGAEHRLDAEDPWDTLTPLFTLRHDRIASAIADRRGWLIVEFESAARLAIGPNGNYENWQLMGPNGILIVGLPGGGEPAVWDAVRDR